MSLNLSSDEEDFDEWVNGAAQNEKFEENPFHNKKTAPLAEKPNAESSDDSDSYDSLDWEDAEEGEKEDGGADGMDRKMPAKAVQIDLGARPTEESSTHTKRKRKRLNKLSNRFLTSEMRQFLVHLSRTHLLCLTSALVSASKSCIDADAIAIIASLVPCRYVDLASHPTVESLRDFTSWLFPFLSYAVQARNQRLWRNRSQGAPSVRRRRTKVSSQGSTPFQAPERGESPLITYARYLAVQYDDNPQLFDTPEDESSIALPNQKAYFFLAMAHSFQWRVRLVQVLEPVRPVLDVDHPMLQSCADLFQRQSSAGKRKKAVEPVAAAKPAPTCTWIEVLCTDVATKTGFRWVPVDPIRKLFDSPNEISKHVQTPLAYIVGVEHKPDTGRFCICDVTPRYTDSWIAVLKRRGIIVGKKSSIDERKTWWARTICQINHGQRNGSGRSADKAAVLDDFPQEEITVEAESEMENAEREELSKLAEQETIPTSKASFQTHPVYAIASLLGKAEVLAPDACKRVCGVFKGQLVYKRSDVSTALTPQKWLYQGRKVKASELGRPIKTIKARKKPTPKSFKALKSYGVGSENDGSEQQRQRDLEAASNPLSDGIESLYAEWQTEPWSPDPVGPNDKIPVNEFRNIELALLNPGLVHIDQPGLAAVAKKLGIAYAPCLLGFEGHGGNRTPTIRGIVVHDHNESLIREAAAEWQNHEDEVNEAKRRKTILSRWKRLMVGLLTKERLDREYGGEDKTK